MMSPTHVAIIMDGNGRWAKLNHAPRTYGHRMGADNIQNIVLAAIENKIKYLTLFAFSCENWKRPKLEVNFLMKILKDKIANPKLLAFLNKHKIQFKWIGFKDKLNIYLIRQLIKIQNDTKNNKDLILSIVFNYGGKQDILLASKLANQNISMENFNNLLLTKSIPDVDLLIRTGGEQRISNFMLWQIAYAEIIFEKTFWPAYNKKHFEKNILQYCSRQRRFGNI